LLSLFIEFKNQKFAATELQATPYTMPILFVADTPSNIFILTNPFCVICPDAISLLKIN
jgi:hypothetical protein